MTHNIRLLSSVLTATLMMAGCSAPATTAPAPAPVAPAPAAATSTQGAPAVVEDAASVVADSGLAGSKSITVDLKAPNDGGYGVKAIVHRWVESDIYEYQVTLKRDDGTGTFVAVGAGLTVVVPRKGTPKTKAVFTNLRQGETYKVEVVAKGDNGGTAASLTLNANTDTSQVFDFSATQDVQDTLSATLAVTLDDVPFNGSATTTLGTANDGAYANPAPGSETGTAQ